ncbi:MAG: beta-ketoacyl-[acyl-carrier-protein] synthase family protein [Planctomycetota bacterium]
MARQSHTSGQQRAGDSGLRGQVVITGMGVVSPIGIGGEAYWESLCRQRSGVGILPDRADMDLPLCMGGAIQGFDPRQYIKPRKALKVMSREIQTGCSAAGLAMQQAGLEGHRVDAQRFGVVFGGDMLYCEPDELQDVYRRCVADGEFSFRRWGKTAMARLYPLWMLMYLPNMIACHIGIAHSARGSSNTICQGETSSLQAMIEAATIILRGRADIMITGGSSSRLSVTPMLYRGMEHLSSRIESPQEACRPFDAARDGTVHGEGAAAFVLESEEHARARGAKVLARLCGWGQFFDHDKRAESPPGRAIGRAIEMALGHAELNADAVGHFNANAAGLVSGDAIEANAVREVLGQVPVTAPASFFGVLGAGRGAVELVASVLALEHGLVPVTLNYTRPDPRCPVNVIHGRPLPAEHPTAVVLNRSQAGQAVAVVLEAGHE